MIAGVSAGGPADLAGIRTGDTIVEVAGRSIENIYDYTYALEALEVGEPTAITVLRSGRRVTLTATPTSRDSRIDVARPGRDLRARWSSPRRCSCDGAPGGT